MKKVILVVLVLATTGCLGQNLLPYRNPNGKWNIRSSWYDSAKVERINNLNHRINKELPQYKLRDVTIGDLPAIEASERQVEISTRGANGEKLNLDHAIDPRSKKDMLTYSHAEKRQAYQYNPKLFGGPDFWWSERLVSCGNFWDGIEFEEYKASLTLSQNSPASTGNATGSNTVVISKVDTVYMHDTVWVERPNQNYAGNQYQQPYGNQYGYQQPIYGSAYYVESQPYYWGVSQPVCWSQSNCQHYNYTYQGRSYNCRQRPVVQQRSGSPVNAPTGYVHGVSPVNGPTGYTHSGGPTNSGNGLYGPTNGSNGSHFHSVGNGATQAPHGLMRH